MKSAPRFFLSFVIAFLTPMMIGISLVFVVVCIALLAQGDDISYLSQLIFEIPHTIFNEMWPYTAAFAYTVSFATCSFKRCRPKSFWRCIGLGAKLTLLVFAGSLFVNLVWFNFGDRRSPRDFFSIIAIAMVATLIPGCMTTWIVRKFQMIIVRRTTP